GTAGGLLRWLTCGEVVKSVLVCVGGKPIELDQPAPELCPLPVTGILFREFDVSHLGQDPHRPGKVGLLNQLDEVEHVPAFLTAEAEPGLLLLIDVEAGRLFLMERAQTPELPALLAQPDMLLDDLDQVEACAA